MLDRALATVDRDLDKLDEGYRFLLTDVRSLIVIAKAFNEAYELAQSHAPRVEAIKAEMEADGEVFTGGIDVSGFDQWFSGMMGGKDESPH
jgi:hypothetical protein